MTADRTGLDRRQFLRLAGLVAAGAGISACSPLYRQLSGLPAPLAGWPPTDPQSFRLVSRLSFGPRAQDLQLVDQIGAEAWVERQLDPQSIDDAGVGWRLRSLDVLSAEAQTLTGWDRADVIGQLQQAALIRQVYSERQLFERMVEFWTDHFNISVHKGDCWFLKPVDDRQVIRAHAMTSFPELLWASAHSPAMLVYLDNQANVSRAPNENYARELMELHTLGVGGGYSQLDVMELSRCLTGWSVRRHFWAGQFQFNQEDHDHGSKQLLGLRIEPAGQAEAERVLELLANHPATAWRIARKLARRFISEEITPEIDGVIARAARRFLDTNGSIRAVLSTILWEGLLAQPSLAQPKFKRPPDFVASALRGLNADSDGGAGLGETLVALGQPAFEWPSPDGPPDESAFWRTNLLPRWRFALRLARNLIDGTEIALDPLLEAATPEEAADRLAALLLGAPLEAARRDGLLAELAQAGAHDRHTLLTVMAAGLIASPGFQWR